MYILAAYSIDPRSSRQAMQFITCDIVSFSVYLRNSMLLTGYLLQNSGSCDSDVGDGNHIRHL